MHALIALVVAAADEAEPSKTAFYIFGGLLAVWAVVLSGIGMSSATFPATAMARRGVIGLTMVLVAAAMATAVITA
ncbi:MAG TPA: hypothetical protein VFG42_26895 [Baekduia sp.]|uniref:hypothetical protein n=1 Tax=Baekduia sp. TaxID=2600305 RepID=UPI002D7A14E2|nr:hypothetical protein [Baekduia sp.]HET6510452.1 hypothetical protein [Baekduia sp.]